MTAIFNYSMHMSEQFEFFADVQILALPYNVHGEEGMVRRRQTMDHVWHAVIVVYHLMSQQGILCDHLQRGLLPVAPAWDLVG